MKKLVLLISALIATVASFAQEPAAAKKLFWDDPFNHPMLPYFIVLALLFVVIILVIIVGAYAVNVVKMLGEQIEKERAQRLGITYTPSPGWWARFTQKLNASVPVDQEKNIELDHSYDGIKELDNHLPPWWKWLFYGTIGWAVVYLIVFHISYGLPLSQEEYQNEIAQAEEQARIRKANQPPAEQIDESKLEFTSDATVIEKGKNIFANNPCGSCHRTDGGGNTIGPNLTDEYWLHGGDAKSIFHTIKDGVVEKGMPAWGKALSPADVRDVTFYILSLQGSNPPNAKSPQGELFKQKDVSIQSDSTKTQASL